MQLSAFGERDPFTFGGLNVTSGLRAARAGTRNETARQLAKHLPVSVRSAALRL
jgi:hypothetical protein